MSNTNLPTTSDVAELNQLTARLTAFERYADLLSACRSGYVPTIYSRGDAAACRALRSQLVLDGCAVFDGMRTLRGAS